MHATLASVQDNHITEINDAASRATGATAKFFSTCSLRLSPSPCAELRFLRAVLFYYSLLAECGAKPVRFCANQTQFKSLLTTDPVAALKIFHALRTQAAHSLDQSSASETLQAITRSWFRQHARADIPSDDNGWDTCAKALDQMGTSLVLAIRAFLGALETDSEMDAMKRELRRSIDGGLSRIEIESLVAEVMAEQGRKDLSPGKLCDRHFSDWYDTLKLKSERTEVLLEARKLIEKTISAIPEPAPFTGKQIMETLGIPQGPQVGELVREQSRLLQSGVKDPQVLLTRLRDLVNKCRQPTPQGTDAQKSQE